LGNVNQEHERVHIWDYSPPELIADVDEDKVLHGTTSMQDKSVEQ
jgi:hypothetical protein